MPRGLDSIPISIKLLVGVIIESFLVLLATIFILVRCQAEEADDDQGHITDDSRDDVEEKKMPRWAERLSDLSQTCAEVFRARQISRPSRSRDGSLRPHKLTHQQVGLVTLASCGRRGDPEQHSARAPVAARGNVTFRLDSRQLDRVFFVLAFVGNTMFLVSLYLSFLY